MESLARRPINFDRKGAKLLLQLAFALFAPLRFSYRNVRNKRYFRSRRHSLPLILRR